MAENKEKSLSDQISDFAMLQFTDEEIATIMRMETKDIIAKHRKDIDRGRLLADAEVRRSVFQMAKQGSTPAQKEFLAMNRRAKDSY